MSPFNAAALAMLIGGAADHWRDTANTFQRRRSCYANRWCSRPLAGHRKHRCFLPRRSTFNDELVETPLNFCCEYCLLVVCCVATRKALIFSCECHRLWRRIKHGTIKVDLAYCTIKTIPGRKEYVHSHGRSDVRTYTHPYSHTPTHAHQRSPMPTHAHPSPPISSAHPCPCKDCKGKFGYIYLLLYFC